MFGARHLATSAGPQSQQLQPQNATGEQVTSGSRQLESPKDGLTYAAVADAPSAPSEPAASSEATTGRKSNIQNLPKFKIALSQSYLLLQIRFPNVHKTYLLRMYSLL
jgi:hypothetical protein